MIFRRPKLLSAGERALLTFIPEKVGMLMTAAILLAFCWEAFRALLDLLDLLPGWSRFAPWTVVVTDRRVLVRKSVFSGRYAEMALPEIRNIEHDWQARRLRLIGVEQAMEIRCNEREAVEILKALKGAYYPPKTFWQWLRGV